MTDLDDLIAEADKAYEDIFNVAKRERDLIRRLADALESVRAERDAALARIAELEADRDGWRTRYGDSYVEQVKQTVRANEAEARIAEAAKLHRRRDDLEYRWGGGPVCDGCGDEDGWASKWPCPTAVALGLNGEENDEV